MRPYVVQPERLTYEDVVGRVLCHDITSVGELGRVKLGKGRVLEQADVLALKTYRSEIHLIEMDPGDVHEDEASTRLAIAVSGPGIEHRGPIESQTQLRASVRGLLEVRVEPLFEINSLPDMSIFTTYDSQLVTPGKIIGATKVTPLVVSGDTLLRAEEIARSAGPIVQVHPFAAGSVGVVVRERLAGTTRQKFESAINMKIGWFGSPLAGICYLPDDVQAIADAVDDFAAQGVSLILAGGVNSTDPLDLTIQALERVGAKTEKRGVPAHPGSTCWLAYLGDIPIFGLALCGMFSKTTVLDLLLPRFLAGRKVRASDLAAFGHGGLLGRDMAFRFPAYTEDKLP